MEELSMETESLQPENIQDISVNISINSEPEPVLENQEVTESIHTIPPSDLFKGKSILELSKSSWARSPKAKEEVQPYLRGCKWSPDGTCCLSVVNNDGIHIMELPRDLYADSVSSERVIDILESVIHVKEAGLVYDFCWYPGMNSGYPETCFWITTIQNAPIQMWDAFDGSLRCTYRGFNAVDEMEPAISITFTSDGSRIVAGYKKMLRTFDVNRPGRECDEHKITSSASCMATDSNLLAVGSWNTSISLYNVNEMGTYKSIGKMHGHSGGVTHMKFTQDGLKLVTGARKDNKLLIWDIRYYRRPLNILTRTVDTNQRVYFDISPCGKYLVTGGTDGILKVWDANVFDWTSSIDTSNIEGDNATFKYPLHRDCCNSVSIHPYKPILATGSGQYHFMDPTTAFEDEDENVPNNSQNLLDRSQNTMDSSQNVMDSSQHAMDSSQNVMDTSQNTMDTQNELNSDENGMGFSQNATDTGQNVINNVFLGTVNIKDINILPKPMTLLSEMKYSVVSENCLGFWWTGTEKE